MHTVIAEGSYQVFKLGSSEWFWLVFSAVTAVLAGVIAKIILFPPGALASVPLIIRLCAIACGFVAVLLVRRSVFAGVLVGKGTRVPAGFSCRWKTT